MEIVALILAAVTLWFLLRRSGKARAKNADNSVGSVPRNPPHQVTPTPERTPEDMLTVSLDAVRKAIRNKALADNAALRDRISSAEKQLAEATALANKLGVTKAVSELADNMQHWHAWSKNERYDFVKEQLVDGLAYSGGESTKANNGNTTSWNEFVFNHKYRLTVANEHWGYDSTDIYASILLEVLDTETHNVVFSAEFVKDGMQDFAPWRTLHVTKFDMGEWLTDIVMLHELIISRKERQYLEAEANYILPKAESLTRNS